MASSFRLARNFLPRIPRSFLTRSQLPRSALAISVPAPCRASSTRHTGFRRSHPADAPITSASTRGETSADRSISDPPVDTFSSLDVYGDIPPPGSAIETIYDDGFIFSSGVRFFDGSGAIMVQGEVFRWRPAERGGAEEGRAVSSGVLELGDEVWGALEVIAPKPGE